MIPFSRPPDRRLVTPGMAITHLLGAAAALAWAACAVAATAPAAQPNILVILSDDHGWADLGVQAARTDLKTPHLDQLARDGVRFARGYVTAPQCVPSRAGLLTGRYQTRFGLEMNPQGPLTLREKTLADRLRTAGYRTGMIGKWHLEPNRETTNTSDGPQPAGAYRPGKRGFDEYFNGTMRNYEASFDLAGRTLPDAPRTIADPRYRIDVQTDAALAFLKRRAAEPGQPFFLYLAYFAPHVPMEKPEPYLGRFTAITDETRRMGLAALAAIDDGVGRIRAALRERKIEENTLIFFIGDNGAPTSRGAWNGSLNDPLVGEKGMLTDGGIRVPFVATWKGRLPAGRVYPEAVSSLDVAATATKLAGLPPDPALDGVNLLPFLTSNSAAAPHEALYWRWRSQAAILAGNWKLVFLAPDHWLLFDHTNDAPETHNVAAEHPEVVTRLRAQLERWARDQNPAGLPRELVPQDRNFFDLHLRLFGGTAVPAPAAGKAKTKKGRAR
jgi:arylsulfatase A-like enzyme